MKTKWFYFLPAMLVFSAAAMAQVTDFGDAPEGALAYPRTGVLGAFPTCIGVGTSTSYIVHMHIFARFGPSIDPEPDGNAGVCPLFNPNSYNQDECFNDNDAGLITPGGFTIIGAVGSEVVVPCTASGGPLGFTCTQIYWGPNIDIQVVNADPVNLKFVNVLIDWDQNGVWGGISTCPGAAAPEYVLADFPIPAGFIGSLSALAPPAFYIGPNSGYVWARFSITDRPIANSSWDGSGMFDDGETEDYLLEIMVEDELDWGDAPDVPYPTLAVSNGANHQISPGFFLGAAIDADPNGQQTPDASGDDNDGDPADDEDGVLLLTQLIFNNPAQIQVTASQPGLLDAWIDYNIDGDWLDAGEQIFASQPLNAGVNALVINVPAITAGTTFARFRLSRAGGLAPTGYHQDGEVEDYQVIVYVPVEMERFEVGVEGGHVRLDWTTRSETENIGFYVYRSKTKEGPFTQITAEIIPGAGNSETTHTYSYLDENVYTGETWYYKVADMNYAGALTFHGPKIARIEAPTEYALEQNYPNPFNPVTSIRFSIKEEGFVKVNIYNTQGQLVRTLVEQQLGPGQHIVTWDSKDNQGQTIATGLYIYTLEVNGFHQTRKMNFIK